MKSLLARLANRLLSVQRLLLGFSGSKYRDAVEKSPACPDPPILARTWHALGESKKQKRFILPDEIGRRPRG
jgi:hypothetical protein